MAAANFDRYNLGFDGTDYAATRLTDNAREDLSDMIYNITPYNTPVLNGIPQGTARNTYTEWQTDDLHSVQTDNARVDGADAGADESEASTRVGNHCQIMDKRIKISGRAEAVDKAGRRSEMAYQLMKAGRSIKRDMEAQVTANNASVAGNASTASEMGGMINWMTNGGLATGIADDLVASDTTGGGYASGAVAAYSFGTARALTETMIRTGMQATYERGGEPTVLMMAPAVKTRLSTYLFSSSARVATLYRDAPDSGVTAQGAVDVFASDFGPLQLRPNRFWGHNGTSANETYIAGLQLNMWAALYLRNFRTNKLARTGDAENRQLLVDWTVRASNEAANFLITDLNTSAVTA